MSDLLTQTTPRSRLWPSWTALALGVLGIALLEVGLFADVLGWVRPMAGAAKAVPFKAGMSASEIAAKELTGNGWYGVTQLVRMNMTPLAWLCYIIACVGLLGVLDRRGWLRRFWHRFWICWLWSVPAWCYFDWMNFYYMRDTTTGKRAWEYINLPPLFEDRVVGYLIAFGAIAPGMFLSAELLMRFGFDRLKTRAMPMPAWAILGVFLVGIPLALVPVIVGGPISNLALWVGTFAVLDPINLWMGRPSILRDWSRGQWGRTLALGAGGLWCGFLWEFWNYWAITKWVYHLPFLGSWEQVRYFEMPVPGLAGFIAFGIQTWVMWQTSLLVLSFFVEGEQGRADDAAVAERMCI